MEEDFFFNLFLHIYSKQKFSVCIWNLNLFNIKTFKVICRHTQNTLDHCIYCCFMNCTDLLYMKFYIYLQYFRVAVAQE